MIIFSKPAGQVLALALLASSLSVGLYAQETTNGSAATGQTSPVSVDESTLPITAAPESPAASGDNSTASSLFAVFRVVIVLALLCAAIWGLIAFLRKSTGINVADDPYLKSVASLPLGQNRAAQVLTLGSRAFLVGVTDHSVNLLAELDDRELIDAMNISADKRSSTAVAGFPALLSSFFPGAKGSLRAGDARGPGTSAYAGGQGGSETVSDSFGAELIRRQRERLGRSVGEGNPEDRQ